MWQSRNMCVSELLLILMKEEARTVLVMFRSYLD